MTIGVAESPVDRAARVSRRRAAEVQAERWQAVFWRIDGRASEARWEIRKMTEAALQAIAAGCMPGV